MAQQEGGWPLGLQPLSMRVGLVRNRNFSGSTSFNALFPGSSSSSSDSSSDLDTESTWSFFQEKSITLGSLIGVSSILDISARPARERRAEASRGNENYRSKTWFFSLCSKVSTDADIVSPHPPSLGYFLEVERRAANGYRSNQIPIVYEVGEFPPVTEPNSLFVGGRVASPGSSQYFDSDGERRSNRGLEDGNGYGVPVLFSCVCGQPTL